MDWTILGRTLRSGRSDVARSGAAVSCVSDIVILVSLFKSNKPNSGHDLAPTGVMIGRVVTGVWRIGEPAAHNSSRSPVAQAGCCHRVFAVVTPFLDWQ